MKAQGMKSQLEALERAGKTIPHLDQEPDLPDDLQPVLSGFFRLSASRSVGMAPSAISIADMAHYHDRFIGGDADSLDEFVTMVQAMDAHWLSKQKATSRRPSQGRGPSRAASSRKTG